MLTIQLIAAIGAIAFFIATVVESYAFLALTALELIDAAHVTAVGFILSTGTLGGAVATHARIEAKLQVACTLIHWLCQAATCDIKPIDATLLTVELIGEITAIIVTITHQSLVHTLSQEAAMHVLRTLTLPALLMLIRGITAVDPSIAFPATGNACSTAALKHSCSTFRCCFASQLIRIVATIVGAIAHQTVVHTRPVVAFVLVGVA